MTTDATPKSATPPPYASYLSFVGFIDWLGTLPRVPDQLDRSLWGGKYSGATGSQLMGALRFLGLVDGNRPTSELRALVAATGNERNALLLEQIRRVYGPDVVDGITGMTPQMLTRAIKDLGATEATARKAESFLINALKAGGIEVPAPIAKKARNRLSGGKRRTPVKKSETPPPASRQVNASTDAPATPSTRSMSLRCGATVGLTLDRDMMQLPIDDLQWVLQIVEMFDSYQASETKGGVVAQIPAHVRESDERPD